MQPAGLNFHISHLTLVPSTPLCTSTCLVRLVISSYFSSLSGLEVFESVSYTGNEKHSFSSSACSRLSDGADFWLGFTRFTNFRACLNSEVFYRPFNGLDW